MTSCLGLYIENNLIKYAKVSKDHETLKVESFGIKFYDKLGDAIKQIISETFSFKIPVSVNLSEEMYEYFYMFNMLSKKDLRKAIQTEFESYCYDKGFNQNVFETRYALVNNLENKEQIKVIHVAANKTEINRRTQQLEGVKVNTLIPTSICIANIVSIKEKENVVIVNMEEKTTITTIMKQKIYNVDKIEQSATEILENINQKENSYTKSYEICKNTTIYTMEGKDLQEEENEHLADIMPTLYTIAQQVKEKLADKLEQIDKIYLTGTACVVNNIDLYFQEFFPEQKCEILKPYFIKNRVKINMKDYIEVNSAIALALQGLGYGLKDMNFKNPAFAERMPDWLKVELGKGAGKEIASKLNLRFDLGEKLDNTEKWLLRTGTGIFAFVILYSAGAYWLNYEISQKRQQVADVTQDTVTQISLIQQDNNTVKEKTNKYTSLITNLENKSKEIAGKNKTKNAIPTLLSEIMYVIPKDVQITSIQNTDTKIVINAQSLKYEQLAYFKVKLKTEGILKPTSIISTPGTKDGEYVKITIEGELP